MRTTGGCGVDGILLGQCHMMAFRAALLMKNATHSTMQSTCRHLANVEWNDAVYTAVRVLLCCTMVAMSVNVAFLLLTRRVMRGRTELRRRSQFYTWRCIGDIVATPAYVLLLIRYGTEMYRDVLWHPVAALPLHLLAIYNMLAVGLLYAILALVRLLAIGHPIYYRCVFTHTTCTAIIVFSMILNMAIALCLSCVSVLGEELLCPLLLLPSCNDWLMLNTTFKLLSSLVFVVNVVVLASWMAILLLLIQRRHSSPYATTTTRTPGKHKAETDLGSYVKLTVHVIIYVLQSMPLLALLLALGFYFPQAKSYIASIQMEIEHRPCCILEGNCEYKVGRETIVISTIISAPILRALVDPLADTLLDDALRKHVFGGRPSSNKQYIRGAQRGTRGTSVVLLKERGTSDMALYEVNLRTMGEEGNMRKRSMSDAVLITTKEGEKRHVTVRRNKTLTTPPVSS